MYAGLKGYTACLVDSGWGEGDVDSRLDLAREAAREAGGLVMGYFREQYEIRQKGEGNPVTTADLEADRALRRILLEGAPGTAWLSEETVDSAGRLDAEEVWVVDPIDGTKEFILGIPEFAISIALAAGGQIVVGAIHNPARDEMFLAERGGGAWLNGERIHVSDRGELGGAGLDASRSESERGEFDAYRSRFQVRLVGSIAYKLARVAAGRSDLTWSLGPKNEWDVAAGVLLVGEAGGRATDPRGGGFAFNRRNPEVAGILASNGRLHRAALDAVAPDLDRRAGR
jgi:myo-inositol-1(or 4)-monophosphatase